MPKVESEDIRKNDEVDMVNTNLDELKWDGLENLAGYIAFKLRHKEKLGSIPNTNEASFSWINHLTEGGLQKPTDEFMIKCNELDKIFIKYNGDSLKIEKNYLQNLCKLAEGVNVSDEVKMLFFRCKMYFKIRILNLVDLSSIRKRKMTKIVK